MANICNTTYVVQGPRKALFEVQHVFNGFKCNDRIFTDPHRAMLDDKFLWMKFDATKGLIIETVGRYITHQFDMLDYIYNINEDVEVAFMTEELNTDVWHKYDPNGVFDNDPDVLIFDDPDIPDAELPEALKRARALSAGCFSCYKKDIEGVDMPGTVHVIVCENITEGVIDTSVKFAMEYSDVTKLEGVKDVRVDCAMNALLMYIICDNGDIIQLAYEFGSQTICATLVGLHCSNDAHIPVCRDEIARKDLMDNLTSDISVLSSDPRSTLMVSQGYIFLHRGHVVYHLKYVDRNIRRAEYGFKGLVKDVLRKHRNGVLLGIADVKVDYLPKMIYETWVLGDLFKEVNK